MRIMRKKIEEKRPLPPPNPLGEMRTQPRRMRGMFYLVVCPWLLLEGEREVKIPSQRMCI